MAKIGVPCVYGLKVLLCASLFIASGVSQARAQSNIYETEEVIFYQSISEDNGVREIGANRIPLASTELVPVEVIDSGPENKGYESNGQQVIKVKMGDEEVELSIDNRQSRFYRRLEGYELSRRSRSNFEGDFVLSFPYNEYQLYRLPVAPGERPDPQHKDVVQLKKIFEGINSSRVVAETDHKEGAGLVALNPSGADESSSSITFMNVPFLHPRDRVVVHPESASKGFIYVDELTPFGVNEPEAGKDSEGRELFLIPVSEVENFSDRSERERTPELLRQFGASAASPYAVVARTDDNKYIELTTGREIRLGYRGESRLSPIYAKRVSKSQIPQGLDSDTRRELEFGQGGAVRLPGNHLYLTKVTGEWRIVQNIGGRTGGLELNQYSELGYQTSAGIRVELGDQVRAKANERFTVSHIQPDGTVLLTGSGGVNYLDLVDQVAPSCEKSLKAAGQVRFAVGNR